MTTRQKRGRFIHRANEVLPVMRALKEDAERLGADYVLVSEMVNIATSALFIAKETVSAVEEMDTEAESAVRSS